MLKSVHFQIALTEERIFRLLSEAYSSPLIFSYPEGFAGDETQDFVHTKHALYH